jgi:hypothetical protein
VVSSVNEHAGTVGEDVEVGFAPASIDVMDVHFPYLPTAVWGSGFVGGTGGEYGGKGKGEREGKNALHGKEFL